MKYKFSYTDAEQIKHARYYSALNSDTAAEMFKASVDHSLSGEVSLISIEYLKDNQWTTILASPAAQPLKKV